MIKVNPEPTLKEMQQWLRWIFTDPRGVTLALNDPDPKISILDGRAEPRCLSRFQAPAVRPLEYIQSDEVLHREDRLSIYSYAYFWRLVDCLAVEFSALRSIFEEKEWADFISRYLLHFPSRSYTLTQLGENFATYLRQDLILKQYPFAVDLADLQWLHSVSFYADDLPPFHFEELQTITPEQWATAKFILDPSLQFAEYSYPVHLIWDNQEDPPKQLELEKTFLKIHRDCQWPHVSVISPEEYSLLKQLASKPLGEIEVANTSPEWFSEQFNGALSSGLIRKLVFQ